MPEIKWAPLSEVNPERDYLAFAEMDERKSVWSFFRFLMRAHAVQGQLNTAKGVIGYTARLGFSNEKVVTVAVFEDKKALTEFAHSEQHAQCLQTSMPYLKAGMKYARWSISGSAVPPKIDDAISRIQHKQ